MTDFQETPALREAMIARSEAPASKAIAIAPDLPDGYAVRGANRLRLQWRWADGQADFARAMELNPNRALTLNGYSAALAIQGRMDEAVAVARKSTQLDPLSDEAWTQLGRVLVGQHRDAEAREALQRALVLNPQQNWANFMMGNMLLSQGQAEQAMAYYQRAPDQFRTTGTAMVEFTRGNEAASKAALAKMESQYVIGFAFQIAHIHAWRGEKDEAFAWLERCLELHDAGMARLRYDPALYPLRGDPRFATLVKKMGFPK
jgi:tetratricopeptide (TPR) repeat protein